MNININKKKYFFILLPTSQTQQTRSTNTDRKLTSGQTLASDETVYI